MEQDWCIEGLLVHYNFILLQYWTLLFYILRNQKTQIPLTAPSTTSLFFRNYCIFTSNLPQCTLSNLNWLKWLRWNLGLMHQSSCQSLHCLKMQSIIFFYSTAINLLLKSIDNYYCLQNYLRIWKQWKGKKYCLYCINLSLEILRDKVQLQDHFLASKYRIF